MAVRPPPVTYEEYSGLDDAIGVEAEVHQLAERSVGLADVHGVPLVLGPGPAGGDHDRVIG
jgi:hypothetical protein